MKLSVIIPVFNEVTTIAQIIKSVRDVAIDKEIIVVDDWSTDGTRERLRAVSDGGVKVFYHEKNKGKGAALRTGFEQVTGDVVVIQDADLEYNPREYHRLLKPILDGRADVVYGSRFLSSDERRVLLFWHSIGNKFLTLLSNMFTNLNLSDMETCYKMFRVEVIREMKLEQNRFGFEPEFTAKIVKKKWRIYEIGISYSGRDYREGKKIGWRDGIVALWCILKYNLMKG
ncbi:MAG: glycosyltransferase family 2 protein [Nitrospirota bacterium]